MNTTTTTPRNVYQMVTDRIIAQMEQGIIPWRKPWHGLNNANPSEVAISYETSRAYSLLNQFLLGEPGEYLTFNQIKTHGGMIRKVVRIPVLKYYNVWNINQVDGIESKAGAVVEPKQPINPEEAAEAIVDGYMTSSNHPKLIVKNSDKAYYCPAGDYVVVPEMQQYDDVAEYYSNLFHELTHSTGHSTRCNRKGITALAAFGGENYSKEELVAEIGAAMLVSQAAIPAERAFKNSVAYLQSWLRALKNDNKMIVWAAGQAEKAAKFILGITE